MSKTTVASLEAVVLEQHQHIAQLAAVVATLTEGVRLLNQRLDNAGRVIKDLQGQVASAPRMVARVQAPSKPNPWFVAIAQIRQERGLVANAWVARDEVLARMEQNAAEAGVAQ
jgi:hypothetical protein